MCWWSGGIIHWPKRGPCRAWRCSASIEPRVVFRAEDNSLLQGLAAQGIGAAIMPMLAIDRSREDTILIDLGNLIPDRRIGLVWHRDRHQTPAAQAFHRLARECAVGDR
jgi:DNA-binding transcriptional LysR family regulator